MRSTLIIVCAIVVFATGAKAQDALKPCRQIKDDGKRLKCYDRLDRSSSSARERLGPSRLDGVTAWIITDEKSPLDDSPLVSAALPSSDDRSHLLMRCKDRKTQVAVSSTGFINCGPNVRVIYRMNQEQPVETPWRSHPSCYLALAPLQSPSFARLPMMARSFCECTITTTRRTTHCSASAMFRRSVRAWRKPANGMPPPPHPVTPRRMRPRPQRRRVRPGGDRNSALGTTHWRDREMLGDPIFWIFVLPGLLLGAYAQSRIKINIAKYSQVSTQVGITGAQVARRLLDSQGLRNVTVESTPGMLSDHYDPRSKTLRLSQARYILHRA